MKKRRSKKRPHPKSRRRKRRFIGSTVRALAEHLMHEKRVVKKLVKVLLSDDEAIRQVAQEYRVSESRAREMIEKIKNGGL